jgi:hypothetical protein
VAKKSGRVRSTGLGLTFCKMAVEAHHGEIGFNSILGQGTTFWFTLQAGVTDKVKLQTIEKEKVIEKEILVLTESEKQMLHPFISQLKDFTIYETDDVSEIIKQIKPLASKNIQKWIVEIEKILITLNQIKYLELLNIF